MKSETLASVRALLVLTLLTGIVYPCAVTLFAVVAFPNTSRGSLVVENGRIVGSRLVGQKFDGPGYFHARPSAADYVTVPSGASNLSPASQALCDLIKKRRETVGAGAPADLVTASGSGLDPHVSPEAALYQVERVALARNVPPGTVAAIVKEHLEAPTLGIFGMPRVNVLELNLSIDERFAKGAR